MQRRSQSTRSCSRRRSTACRPAAYPRDSKRREGMPPRSAQAPAAASIPPPPPMKPAVRHRTERVRVHVLPDEDVWQSCGPLIEVEQGRRLGLHEQREPLRECDGAIGHRDGHVVDGRRCRRPAQDSRRRQRQPAGQSRRAPRLAASARGREGVVIDRTLHRNRQDRASVILRLDMRRVTLKFSAIAEASSPTARTHSFQRLSAFRSGRRREDTLSPPGNVEPAATDHDTGPVLAHAMIASE